MQASIETRRQEIEKDLEAAQRDYNAAAVALAEQGWDEAVQKKLGKARDRIVQGEDALRDLKNVAELKSRKDQVAQRADDARKSLENANSHLQRREDLARELTEALRNLGRLYEAFWHETNGARSAIRMHPAISWEQWADALGQREDLDVKLATVATSANLGPILGKCFDQRAEMAGDGFAKYVKARNAKALRLLEDSEPKEIA